MVGKQAIVICVSHTARGSCSSSQKHEPLGLALETTEEEQVSDARNVFWKAGPGCLVPVGLPRTAYNQRLKR